MGAISAKNSNPKQVFQVVDNFIANLKSKDEPVTSFLHHSIYALLVEAKVVALCWRNWTSSES